MNASGPCVCVVLTPPYPPGSVRTHAGAGYRQRARHTPDSGRTCSDPAREAAPCAHGSYRPIKGRWAIGNSRQYKLKHVVTENRQ